MLARAEVSGPYALHGVERHGTGARRLPPFGKTISAIVADPSRLINFVGCTANRASVWIANGPSGWDWQAAHPRHLSVVLPDGEDPQRYRWDFLSGHHPILILRPLADDPEGRAELAAAMLHDGVASALALGSNAWPLFTRAMTA